MRIFKFGVAFAAMVTLLFMTVAPVCADPGGGNNFPTALTLSCNVDTMTALVCASPQNQNAICDTFETAGNTERTTASELATANLNNNTDLNQNTGADTAINGRNTDVVISTEGAIKEGLGDVILPNNPTAIANTDNQARNFIKLAPSGAPLVTAGLPASTANGS